jgi:hypothetical protein
VLKDVLQCLLCTHSTPLQAASEQAEHAINDDDSSTATSSKGAAAAADHRPKARPLRAGDMVTYFNKVEGANQKGNK